MTIACRRLTHRDCGRWTLPEPNDQPRDVLKREPVKLAMNEKTAMLYLANPRGASPGHSRQR